ncbi:hypothetical protein NVP1244A_130 [Vibrio phage 1.244.A._10N.261.54.C3]|nr:hypothetical protein NVP1244A_130 [Vibrio phage 1.244.A._10N.261.54.C3]AUR98758.1 hypothetical protein NVP1255O_130 [Vibrio phage 1.255.O._10N.286.45.F1]
MKQHTNKPIDNLSVDVGKVKGVQPVFYISRHNAISQVRSIMWRYNLDWNDQDIGWGDAETAQGLVDAINELYDKYEGFEVMTVTMTLQYIKHARMCKLINDLRYGETSPRCDMFLDKMNRRNDRVAFVNVHGHMYQRML